MGFIRLQTNNQRPAGPPIRFLDERGREQVVPLLRLRLRAWFGKDPSRSSRDERPNYNAILDTGAPLTVIPKHFWQNFASQIVPLQAIGDRPPIGRAGGRHFSYYLGGVWVGVTDLFGRHLPALPVLAQFREDDIPPGEPLPPILFGLWGGILEGRQLTRWPTTERYDPNRPTVESYGQWWHLSEP